MADERKISALLEPVLGAPLQAELAQNSFFVEMARSFSGAKRDGPRWVFPLQTSPQASAWMAQHGTGALAAGLIELCNHAGRTLKEHLGLSGMGFLARSLVVGQMPGVKDFDGGQLVVTFNLTAINVKDLLTIQAEIIRPDSSCAAQWDYTLFGMNLSQL